MTAEQMQDFTRRIPQANSTQLVVILYEMLSCYVEDGEEAIDREDDQGLRNAVRKAKGCLSELMHSVRPQYNPGPALLSLSGYCVRLLTVAEIRRDKEALKNVERVITPLRDAYDKIADRNTSGPVMGNYQTVYTGLTYGKTALSENMTDQSTNRGMYA